MVKVLLFLSTIFSISSGIDLRRTGYTLMYTHDIGYDTTWSYSFVVQCGSDSVQSIVMYERNGIFYDHNFVPFCMSSFAGVAAQEKSESGGIDSNTTSTQAGN